MMFLEIFYDNIKDINTNKVNCVKQKSWKQKYPGALLPVPYGCISFRKSYGIYSCLLLSLIKLFAEAVKHIHIFRSA